MPKLCEVCGAYEGTHHRHRGGHPCPLAPPPLKWTKPPRPGYQATQCGRYFVEREPHHSDYPGQWHAHMQEDGAEETLLTFDSFRTREEAKAYCERHNQEHD